MLIPNYSNILRDIRSNMENEIKTIITEEFNGEFDSADPKLDAETCTIYVEDDWGGDQDRVKIDRIAYSSVEDEILLYEEGEIPYSLNEITIESVLNILEWLNNITIS